MQPQIFDPGPLPTQLKASRTPVLYIYIYIYTYAVSHDTILFLCCTEHLPLYQYDTILFLCHTENLPIQIQASRLFVPKLCHLMLYYMLY